MKNRFLLSLLSVVLFSAGWLRISGLPLLGALVPLMFISRGYDASRRSFWRMTGWTMCTILLWCAATIRWIWYATPIGPIAAAIAQCLLFGGVFLLYHYVSKRASSRLAELILVCGWIAAEYIYLTGELSFPWLLLGNGFANDTWAIQWYEYTGIFGGTLWVLTANLLIYHTILSHGAKRLALSTAVWIVVPLAVSLFLYFSYREEAGEKLTVTIVQPNIDPYGEKFVLAQKQQNELLLSLASEAPAGVDYIVMPETALDDNIWEERIELSESIDTLSRFMASRYPEAQLIVGATTCRRYLSESECSETARYRNGVWYDVYNSALAIDTAGVSVAHKSKLVIGAEKMPYMNLLKPLEVFIVDLGGTTGRLGYDKAQRTFHTQGRHPYDICSAAPICYESVYGEYFAGFVDRGAQIIFVITNDGWWYDTPGYRQHFSYSRLRAIETRRWIARSANTGISGFIDPRGDVIQRLGWEERGTLTGSVTALGKKTFYVRYGDYIARICSLVFVLGLLYYIAYRFRRKSHLVK